MQVITFAAAREAGLEETGGVIAEGFPMTSCYVHRFPAQITVSVILAVYTSGGSEYEPRRFVVAKSPDGQRVGSLESVWHWPDKPGSPFKFRVFAHRLPLEVPMSGVYSIGLYEDVDAEPEAAFPLPILKLNPLTGVPTS
ncbi:hypothetical protein [Mycolicibacterium sarraceniae]|uniref:Uncharacterized protein n=1 Tax=Mycolicibacterium sarraceniae TaxID=1534348 RepID=A0A7I7SRU8_9MYCO|nr:hypothetical protein [Mycolicibacterium sarraceniae]BBY59538.1 hypothetical protein MSAR_26740 [Mycolicibacterium sarraceniae]